MRVYDLYSGSFSSSPSQFPCAIMSSCSGTSHTWCWWGWHSPSRVLFASTRLDFSKEPVLNSNGPDSKWLWLSKSQVTILPACPNGIEKTFRHIQAASLNLLLPDPSEAWFLPSCVWGYLRFLFGTWRCIFMHFWCDLANLWIFHMTVRYGIFFWIRDVQVLHVSLLKSKKDRCGSYCSWCSSSI